MTLDDEEVRERLRGIENGPWAEKGAEIRAYIQPKTPLEALLGQDDGGWIALDELPLSSADRRREKELQELFRGHWEDDDGVDDEDELRLRDSFDEDLTLFQLYELAVQTGYLPVENLPGTLRAELVKRLWSKGARKFIEIYDYMAVEFLARRLRIDTGSGPRDAPPPEDASEVEFATFLSQHRLWYVGGAFEKWLDFLDDYADDIDDPKDALYDFLTKPAKEFDGEEAEYIETVLTGAGQFLDLLANLYLTLQPASRGRYGAFYAYWMAKFFGFGLGKNGYSGAEDEEDWAKLLMACQRRFALNEKTEISYGGFMRGRVEVVWMFWQSARDFLDRAVAGS